MHCVHSFQGHTAAVDWSVYQRLLLVGDPFARIWCLSSTGRWRSHCIHALLLWNTYSYFLWRIMASVPRIFRVGCVTQPEIENAPRLDVYYLGLLCGQERFDCSRSGPLYQGSKIKAHNVVQKRFVIFIEISSVFLGDTASTAQLT